MTRKWKNLLLKVLLRVSNLFLYKKRIFFITFFYKFYEITCTFFICHCNTMVINYKYDLVSDDYKSQDCKYLCIILTISDNNNTKLSFHLTFPLYS